MFEFIDYVTRNSAPPPTPVPHNVALLREILGRITQQVAFGELTPA